MKYYNTNHFHPSRIDNEKRDSFQEAQLFLTGYYIEYLYAMEIKEKFHDWDHPSFLVDWLLDSEFHVMLCQGIYNQMFGI